jgi:hypothetical protein
MKINEFDDEKRGTSLPRIPSQTNQHPKYISPFAIPDDAEVQIILFRFLG